MIVLENVHKSLEGREVLRGLDFKVEKGEIFVIVGPTGTGKSVTLQHVIGLLSPDSGRVIVNGLDAAELKGRSLEKYRSKFGMLFQSGALINWLNVWENVSLPLKEKRKMKLPEIQKKVSEVLSLLGLDGIEGKMPESLSGGMRKRVGLARAIITEPEILLYDEPTSGLDPIMARKIDGLIMSLSEKLKITSLVVTHDLVTAFGIADRIAMLYDGRIIECSSPAEFKKSEVEYVREFIKQSFTLNGI